MENLLCFLLDTGCFGLNVVREFIESLVFVSVKNHWMVIDMNGVNTVSINKKETNYTPFSYCRFVAQLLTSFVQLNICFLKLGTI